MNNYCEIAMRLAGLLSDLEDIEEMLPNNDEPLGVVIAVVRNGIEIAEDFTLDRIQSKMDH